ncbi:LOW QUALITY PROTEIN: uncharacterized protein LOC141973265 [Athene noctua]|uniref:LOW QUALITY PROTEIN: uncharacterized protein LOC141973265 n=1 Tax=Athene noctua TaxID=126797 RepID=UPI003EB98016
MNMEEIGIQQINQIYPQKELKEARKHFKENPGVRPLIKAEYAYINDEDNDPHIKEIKEIPYTLTELAKIKREYGRLPKESEAEYVWCASLTRGDQIQINEKEVSGYWGHGIFLTTGNRRTPWYLTQRAAYWARGLNPLDRGDPLAITGTVDQLLESGHKAACLQMVHERKLVPGCESPMMLLVNPEIMAPLIRGFPESLRSTRIEFQRTIASLDPAEKLESFIKCRKDDTNASTDSPFNHSLTPSHPKHKRMWTWRDAAQELIDYSRKYGPVRTPEEKSKGIHQVGAKDLPLSVRSTEVMNVALVKLTLPGEENAVTINMVVGNIPTNLLGIDALKRKGWEDSEGLLWTFRTPKLNIRRLQNASPLPFSKVTDVKQYPLPLEEKEGLKPVMQEMREQGVVCLI